ncbi:type II secretion system protein [Janthinobacterium fluminis]|uniref:Type II secretion system protein n=1 Tax=Janthinobacterium fluminis TaxID=2987524 RepID=A0ABT5K648_9BURK|nr:type II secretion system protein [Janthinobacterium fluminis]MDC8760399.1 type II secretion system protein [Janthinobacterium fluminis]
MSGKPARRQRGVTLIELIVFIVILGIALAGVLQMLNLATRLGVDPVRRKQALLIAEGLMEEVQLAHFTWCDPLDPRAEEAASPADCSIPEQLGPEAGNARPFDNVNDYVTQLDTPTPAFDNAAGRLVDANGDNFGPPGYTALLTVSADNRLGPAGAQIASGSAPAAMNVLRLSVSVRYGTAAADLVVLDGYRSRYAPRSVP